MTIIYNKPYNAENNVDFYQQKSAIINKCWQWTMIVDNEVILKQIWKDNT